MTASTASRHMYAIASWSPSQSEPLTVSNMCQRQSSFSIFPKAALMPPCAATVWLRVGNTLVMQAVFRPAATIPSVARSPAPPAPRTMTSNSWSMMGGPAPDQDEGHQQPALRRVFRHFGQLIGAQDLRADRLGVAQGLERRRMGGETVVSEIAR